MAELGALSLRIETVGDRQALTALDAIDRKAQQTAGSEVKLTAAQKALNKEIAEGTRLFALQGRTADVTNKQLVTSIRQAGLAQLQYMQRIGASETQMLQFASAVQSFEKRVASSSQAVGVATQRVSAFGRSGLNAFNALAFGASQMAATGTASFRSLATSAASVLSFFGPAGAITAAITATGLVIVDVFTRSRREIEETRKKATEEAKKLRESIEEQRQTGQQDVLIDRAKTATRKLAEAEKERAQIAAKLLPLDEKYAQVRQLSSVAAALLRRNEDEATKSLRARNEELRTSIQLLTAEKDAATAAAKSIVSQGTPGTGVLPGRTTEGRQAKTKEELDAEIAAEIGNLLKLSKVRQLSGAEVLRLGELERGLAREMATTFPTKEREIELWEQIKKAREAANLPIDRTIPVPEVQPITQGTPQAAAPGTLAIPPSLAAKLDPAQIAKDVAAADAAAAERIRAQNFHETATALSETLANTLANGIASGFAMGLSQGGIGEGFKQMAAQLAAGLGSVAIDYGLKAILTAQAMAKVAAWLVANPILAIGAGFALVALGKAFGGKGGASRGGAGSSFGGMGSASGDDTIRSFVLGSNRNSPLSGLSDQLQKTITDLRRSTFGASDVTALSPRSSLGSMATAGAPTNPFSGMQFLVVNSPSGQSFVAREVNTYNRDRGGG